ncbi:DNA-directed RNA polymerase subunit omega [Dolosigranulum savutiense]|uniref:DNA-directed RNA polymerase subunit omega n=1 Tax=Dolosigranulum savutiense TaxID=3110288 RepID=A0AB74TZK6_9LACT
MLLHPSLDKLLNRIDSKYSLVMLSAKRAHQLAEDESSGGEEMLEEYQSIRNVGKALEEIEAGDLVIDSSQLNKE